MSAGFISSETSFLGSETATFLLCAHVVFCVCTHTSLVSLCPNFLFLKGHQSNGLGLTLPHLNYLSFFKILFIYFQREEKGERDRNINV